MWSYSTREVCLVLLGSIFTGDICIKQTMVHIVGLTCLPILQTLTFNSRKIMSVDLMLNTKSIPQAREKKLGIEV